MHGPNESTPKPKCLKPPNPFSFPSSLSLSLSLLTTMKKLLNYCTSCSWCNYNGISRFLLYSTETLPYSASKETLYGRITIAGDPRVSIVQILDQWVREGRGIEQGELRKIIRQLRNYKRYKHALEISEWMSDKTYLDLLPGDVAVQLDLISKVRGLEQAEKYFHNIPNTSRVFQVYGALLNCYAHAKSLDKAEAIMQKMRDLGFSRTSLSYNAMLKLYSQMGKDEKLDFLMAEMEEKGISCDKFTFNIRLNAYAAASDIEGMEKLLMKMEVYPLFSIDWNAYVVAANGYLKVGLVEKALAMLKKSEQLITIKTRRLAYEILLSMYATAGKKDEVYRIWNLYKKIGRVYNMSYLCMVSALVKLDDLDGAEKILVEWEAENKYFDFRVPNLLVSAYCRKGLFVEAESIVSRLIESGKEPNASTWDRLAFGYHKYNQMAKAVETMKKAILASQPGWKPNSVILASCLEYLKGKEDVEAAEELISLLGERGHFSTDMHNKLVDNIKNGNPEPKILDQMAGDDQPLEGEKLGGMEFKLSEESGSEATVN
ncbi:hypothetical protein F0562_010808 [Nyssa sinensis]|uniref:Pentacotripeptide-repeat region of PRORP domain-containing protein n=1 Tax=Nyssa sinensis TaxID=561372 RepID=A0A5J5A4R4_9ASTE|nr:hypothetical protein F0562_010808 [Nyssa sinensis]